MNATHTRLFYGWWIVAVTAVCLLFSEPTVAVFSFSVFLKAVSEDFHAGRGAVSLAFTIHDLCLATISPFVGRLIDRFGVRRVVLPSASSQKVELFSKKGVRFDAEDGSTRNSFPPADSPQPAVRASALSVKLLTHLERCPSGLRSTLGKRV
jgi:hypothetical protein